MQPVIVVHGGAWAVPDNKVEESLAGIKNALRIGYGLLSNGAACVDAVVAAVASLEDDENFDAGKGSVLNVNSEIEMHAMVMRGIDMNCGGVVAVRNIKNPIKLANIVLEESEHCVLDANASLKLARKRGVEERELKYFITEQNIAELEEMKKYKSTIKNLFDNQLAHDTVGAVAIDKFGNIASATSTGGITAQIAGRVSDSPCPGAGGFADNNTGVSFGNILLVNPLSEGHMAWPKFVTQYQEGSNPLSLSIKNRPTQAKSITYSPKLISNEVAVSTTGHGEAILKTSLARTISLYVEQGKELSDASKMALDYMKTRTNGYGGAIAVDKSGNVSVDFNTKRMPWGVCGAKFDIQNQTSCAKDCENIYFGINPGEQFVENV